MNEPYPHPKPPKSKRPPLTVNKPIHRQNLFYRMEKLLSEGEVKVETNSNRMKDVNHA